MCSRRDAPQEGGHAGSARLDVDGYWGALQLLRFNRSLGRLKMAWLPARMSIGRAQTWGLFLVGSGLLPLARSVPRLLPQCSTVLVLRLMILSVRELSARCKVILGPP